MTPFPPPSGPPDPYPFDDHTYDLVEYVHPDNHPDHAVPLFVWLDGDGDPYWTQF